MAIDRDIDLDGFLGNLNNTRYDEKEISNRSIQIKQILGVKECAGQ